ncbi:PepSY domain-containing protein [Zestomonas thermotolerans]|uniref:PepSY domain-containing protein n=1 Tax=Zestomonas thermotolerans TaxID=157784 RepID=UPI0004769535|nr:sulfite reductase flavoprotein subunit alpha [Pseudomonas thermotolerans]
MFKKIIFQLHWFFGISAGLVLAIMGVSGALYSFQAEILQALNPEVLRVEPAGQARLSLDQLIERIEAAKGSQVAGLSLSEAPNEPARANMLPAPGQRRGEMVLVDPYSGELLGEPKGTGFFMLMFQLHRWLAMGDFGKQLTGASTIALLFFCLSGLYLRWPRQALNWRAWLTLNWAKKGRSFNWDLHAVTGTWVLLVYLLAALTGLYFSYDWYRAGATRLLSDGAAMQGPGGERRAQPGRGERGGRPAPQVSVARLAADDYQRIEAALREAAGERLASWNLRLPAAAGQPVQVNYLLDDAPHERAGNMLSIDPVTGAVKGHRRYADKPAGEQLLQSVYPLHTGEYFGLPGRLIMAVASLIMPLFFITGWLLYLDRRRKKRAVKALRGTPGADSGEDAWLIGFASQSGFAEQLAWQTAGQLQSAGLAARVEPLGRLDEEGLRTARNALFVVSTFGDGEAPDSARGFERKLLGRTLGLEQLSYAVLALGDRQYQQFCGFARRLNDWLGRQGARSLFAPVEVDGGDAQALKRWQRQLAELTGAQPLAQDEAAFEGWTLSRRELLNPGSQGAPTFLLGLVPQQPRSWEAGDILEVLPRHAEARVRAWLEPLGLDGEQPVSVADLRLPLREALAGRQLPESTAHLVGLHAQALVDALVPLESREYSIASLPSDGVLELIVRQERRADGSLGLGSGWLTEHAPLGTTVLARLRRNSGFHVPEDDRPLILIGNGTGLAGLRALLKARMVAGHSRNWLLFGERNRAHDFYCRAELEAALQKGDLQRLDLAFSRDQAEKLYVQDRLREQGEELRRWIAEGAALYVCGSLEGMAGGVDAVLRELLGDAAVEGLSETGRYRRDVY